MASVFQEKDILKKLKFRLNAPTLYVFMLKFLRAAQSDTKVCSELSSQISSQVTSKGHAFCSVSCELRFLKGSGSSIVNGY